MMARRARRQRRCMTLVEVLIAAALTAVLLAGLLGYYHHIELLSVELKKVREEGVTRRYAQFRLARIIPTAVVHRNKKTYPFFTNGSTTPRIVGESLVFTYDRGVDEMAAFSYEVLGRLFLDDEGQLCLATWPLPHADDADGESPLMKKEVLLDKVKKLAFAFYMPPDRQRLIVDGRLAVETGKEEVVPAFDQWHAEWRREYGQLPAMIKITITRRGGQGNKDEQLVYAFPLPNTKNTILYRR